MRKLILLSLGLLPLLAQAQTPPERIDFQNNVTINVTLSDVDTNRIFIDGDKIKGVYCPDGTCVAHNDPSGSAYLSIAKSIPAFTAYASTQAGRHFALFIRPSSVPAKTIELIPQGGGVLKASSKSADYQDRLAKLIAAMSQGKVIDGYGISAVKDSKSITINKQYTLKLESIYQGAELQGFAYSVTNITDKPVKLTDNTFYSHGVRAIALSKKILWAHESGFIWEVR